MSDNKEQKAKQKRKRAPRSRASRAKVDDRDILVRGNGNVVNRGDYELFPMLSRALGPFMSIFSPLLGFLEEGRGDYKVRKNSLILSGTPPSLDSNVKKDFHRIQHREFIGYVSSSSGSDPSGKSAFKNASYPLNPGQSSTFPWLSQIAANYEEWELMGAIVFYRPTSGNATGANTSLGEVIIATNYNAAAPVFPNSINMLNSEYASSGPPSQPFVHMIECEPHKNPVSELYVRTGGVPASEDIKTYDLGLIQVATQGQQTLSQQLGELWITYDVAFYKPFLGGVVSGNDIPTDHFQLTGVASATPLGTSQLQVVPRGQIGGTINGATGTVYQFPAAFSEGTYMICYQCQGTAAALTAFTMTANTSYTVLQVWATNVVVDGKIIASAPSTGGTSGVFIHCQIIQFATNPTVPVTVTYGAGGTLPSGTTYGDLIVTQINSNLASALIKRQEVGELVDLRDRVESLQYYVDRLTKIVAETGRTTTGY